MKTTDLKIGDWVRYKIKSPQGERVSIPMQVVGIFSSFNKTSPKDTVYLDFDGNEGDVLEEEVQNLVFTEEDEVRKVYLDSEGNVVDILEEEVQNLAITKNNKKAITNGIIKDGTYYEAYESGLDPCFGCIFLHSYCGAGKEPHPCRFFGIDYKFIGKGKVSEIIFKNSDNEREGK